jgi:hypothetical protein
MFIILFTLRLISNQIYFARTDPQVAMMREMLRFPVHDRVETPEMEAMENPLQTFQLAHAVDYLSDMSNDGADIDDHADMHASTP